MRSYLRNRGRRDPAWALWRRAKKRADGKRLPFTISVKSIVIPDACPVLGIPLISSEGRVPGSPSLDRVVPGKGYVDGNCRVISDRANQLKSNLDRAGLVARAKFGKPVLRDDYAALADYVDREELLAEVRLKAAAGGRCGAEWAKIAAFLEVRFRSGQGLG